MAKAKLASRIIELLKKRGLNQTKAADILGIDQPKISALYRGRLSDFSISRLIKFLMLLEQDVEIKIKDKSISKDHFGHLFVAIAT